jgi:RNA polymerase sigma-70 factor (ECF subfamily)
VVKRRLGRAAAAAEHVLLDAWVRAGDVPALFRGESSVRTGLVGIAINCARDRLRRSARDHGRDAQLATISEIPSPPPLPARVATVDLERAIAQLADGYRDVLILHDVFGYTHEEIARMLGVESGTSKSQLSRARSTLRRRLGAKGTEHHERRSETELD